MPGNRLAVLNALGLLSFALYVLLARMAPGNGWRDTAFFLTVMAALFVAYAGAFRQLERFDHRRAGLIIIGSALLFRLALVPAGLPRDTPVTDVLPLLAADLTGREVVFEDHLLYDDDHWRYLWDGHVAAQGVDPFALAPQDRRLDRLAAGSPLWDEIRDNVNHPWLTTIYPPLSQIVFRLLHAIAPASVVALKIAWIVVDLAVILLVKKTLEALQRPPSLLLLYAWNPLLIKVTAGSAHFDVLVSLGVALLTYGVARRMEARVSLPSLRRYRIAIAGGWVLAAAAKVSPLVILLPVARRVGLVWTAAAAAAVAMLLLPLIGTGGGSEAFARDWEFNATFFHLVKTLFWWTDAPGMWARLAVGVAVVVAGVWAMRRFDRGASDVDGFARAALIPMAILLIGGPVLMPWYLVWVLPLAAVTRTIFWFQLTAITQLAFLVMADGREHAVVLFLQAILTTVAMIGWLRRCTDDATNAASAAEGDSQ